MKDMFRLSLVLLMLAGCHPAVPELVHLHYLMRHGQRSPMEQYPHDAIPESTWPDGYAQLTWKGMRQLHDLGINFRSRYQNFLPTTYHREDVVVRSTDVDRTLQSALAHLSGLFYPNTSDSGRFNISIPWFPIPIHTTSLPTEFLMGAYYDCPRYDELERDILKYAAVQPVIQRYEDFFNVLSNYTGYKDVNVSTVWRIYDTLFCEKSSNLSLPDWVTTDVWSNLTWINNFGWRLLYYNSELQRLRAGMLLGAIRNHMIDKQRGIHSSRGNKLFIYSGHDTDVAALLSILDIFNQIQPPFASAIILELHKNGTMWFVRSFYHNTTDSGGFDLEPYPMRMPSCSSMDCPLEEFLKITKNQTFNSSEQFKNACRLRSDVVDKDISFCDAIELFLRKYSILLNCMDFFILFGVFAVTLFIVMGALRCFLQRDKVWFTGSNSQYNYKLIRDDAVE